METKLVLREALTKERTSRFLERRRIAKNLFGLGYTYREIGEIMGISESAVRSCVSPLRDFVEEKKTEENGG